MDYPYNGWRIEVRTTRLLDGKQCHVFILLHQPQPYTPAIPLDVPEPVPLLGAYETALALAKEHIDKM
jgi:hypothetical protein